ncbi:MAG: aminotransferase class III-fold pyridoxal phosphate-dependent enzyme [Planctomycetota bacterium]|nr:aminotransferase class III-fold pyridoxal phosphate-dependent enzyme [Planctomycetota bacterium]
MSTTTAYDHQAEAARLSFPDIILRGVTLNRSAARVELHAPLERPELEEARRAYWETSLPNTLDPKSPVLELGWPVAGPYVACPAGVYMDLYLGVAQKLIDESHPRLKKVAEALQTHRLLFRREINTDDYMLLAKGLEHIAGPTELAGLMTGLAASRWPDAGGYRAFLSNSGAESVEAALKVAWVVKYKKFLEKHGAATLQKLMAQLGVPEVAYFEGVGDVPVYANYPFTIVACEGAFHGRTLGALHATRSKAVHQYGYPKSAGMRHIAYNTGDLGAVIDPRSITEILDAPGGVGGVMDSGRIPADLFAGFLVEPFQGEGGYVPGDPAFFRACQDVCRRSDAYLICDEVQTFGRTGTLFMTEQLGVTPDVIAVAKAAVVGFTLARADCERYLHGGWHSNTFGGGKIFDLSFSYAVIDTVANGTNPVFDGLSYLENCVAKGEYLASKLDKIATRHPRTVTDHEGRGLMHGVGVNNRDAILDEGWKRGLKMLGCGPSGDPSRIRLLFLADTLSREIDDFARVFEETIEAVEGTR